MPIYLYRVCRVCPSTYACLFASVKHLSKRRGERKGDRMCVRARVATREATMHEPLDRLLHLDLKHVSVVVHARARANACVRVFARVCVC